MPDSVLELTREAAAVCVLHRPAVLHAVRMVSAREEVAVRVLHLALRLHTFNKCAVELSAVRVRVEALAVHQTVVPSARVDFAVVELHHALALLDTVQHLADVALLDFVVDHFAF